MTDLNPMDPKPKRTRKSPARKKQPRHKALITAVVALVVAVADFLITTRIFGLL